MIQRLQGPILIFGAGGFIGVNLLTMILAERKDVYGVSQTPRSNWRLLENHLLQEHLLACDINDFTLLKPLIEKVRPRTIFQLSAYGAYSKQQEYHKIYRTNFNAVVDMVELLKNQGFAALVQAGSNSEYGLNAAGPPEEGELRPNSHYAVSKVAAYYALKYYGQVEKLPVLNLRIYSAYGPWEEPDRLIPQLLARGRSGSYPPLVNAAISRDFVHVNDVCRAFILAALAAAEHAGESFNIGTGKRTTLGELVELVRKLCHVTQEPDFQTMPDRSWDTIDWYSQPARALAELGWKAQTPLEEGLQSTLEWQKQVGFDRAIWNWTRT